MPIFELQIVAACLLDLTFGDPRWIPHPVRGIGFFCEVCEKFSRKIFGSEYFAGCFAVFSVIALSLSVVIVSLFLVNSFSVWAAQCCAVMLLYSLIAAKDLIQHSCAVYEKLKRNDTLERARHAVAQIVGRDTANLDRNGITRACVETVAENMVDGVTAPLFYAFLFSLFSSWSGVNPIFLAVTGVTFYKAVNTMDSMFGYKNDRYINFGRFAAKLDDLVNFIPARISGLAIVAASFFLGLNWHSAYMIFLRDRLAHASPNAAHPEAAVAGALTIQLGGTSSYFGKAIVKPVIGDSVRNIQIEDILKTNDLMLWGSCIFLILLIFIRFAFLQVL